MFGDVHETMYVLNEAEPLVILVEYSLSVHRSQLGTKSVCCASLVLEETRGLIARKGFQACILGHSDIALTVNLKDMLTYCFIMCLALYM